MSLQTSLSIASSGLSAVQYELNVASQNVANASTTGYVSETANVASRSSGGEGDGVKITLTTRATNSAVQDELYSQNATVAGLTVTSNALSAVSAVQGSTSSSSGSSGSLSDDLGNLKNDFTTLESDPSITTQQDTVISDASTLANAIQTLSSTYQTQRQDAQESIVSEVDTINTSLSTIGSLSTSIVQMKAAGEDTADLENQRSEAMDTLSSSLSVKYTETSSGDMLVTTEDGTSLSTHASSGPLSTSDTTIDATSAYPGSIPAITINGKDVTSSLTGGSLGANITLRDTTLPTMQAELDSFASTLSTRFSSNGLTLFTDASGNTSGSDPTKTASNGGQLGFSSTIQVNANVKSNPSWVSYGDNQSSGSQTGSTTQIATILSTTFGTSSTSTTATQTGLGVNGTLSAPYSGSSSLSTLATDLTTSQASTISDASSQKTTQTDIQTSLQSSLSSSSGVSVDSQLSIVVALQNAYEANAKVVSTVQTMFSALLDAVK